MTRASILTATMFCVLGACAAAPRDGGINDPYEATNRRIHASSKVVDRAVVRPVSVAYGTVVPRPVRRGVANLADTLDTPRFILNDLLQGRIGDAGHNFARLTLNVVFGLGLLDVASSAGVERRPSGFGETLYRWGAPEGAFLSLPVLGPSTQRDAAGTVVDIAMNPVRALIASDEAWVPPAAGVATAFDTRYESRSTIDDLLYNSVDSYAQTRSVYLQNRHFQLGHGAADEAPFDPYEAIDGQ